MKKIIIILLSIIIISAGLIACQKKSDEKNTLEIYLVSGALTDDKSIGIDSLILEKTPIITLDDIQRYYWEDQVFIMKKDLLSDRLNEQTGQTYTSRGFPYVVIANGERIYMGKFWSHASSQHEFFTPLIYIELSFGAEGADYDLQPDEQIYEVTWIELQNDDNDWKNLREQTEKTIWDERIYKVLKNAGKLSEGE